MFDIYTNRIPFGLLTEDERAALKAHPGPWIVTRYNRPSDWEPATDSIWVDGVIYRAVKPAPEPLWVAPEVWAVLDKKWQWAARDRSGSIFAHGGYPMEETSGWANVFSEYFRLSGSNFAPHLIRPGTVAWGQSLIQRPEGV